METDAYPLPELKQLNPLVGRWLTEGEVLPTPSSQSIAVKGTDRYEWVCAGRFLLHRADVRVGEENVKVIEMIGYDPATHTYPMRSFDSHGNFSTMQSSVDESGVWKIRGEGMRSTLFISEDGKQMKAFWERSEDGVRWMDMQFMKAP